MCVISSKQNTDIESFRFPFLPIGDLDIQERVTEALFQHPAVVADLARWNARHLFTGIPPQYEFMGVGAPPRHWRVEWETVEHWGNR
ncbi:MAG: hypothetical protein CM1200mP41_37320 [Gammaproteobacteria bacterium]|nr:MAG: hypothetical protein CM1200mP41_37320 [Gammaproteobacteria bacterium]